MDVTQEDARSRILAAAGPIFAERGFEAATVREICRQAEVNLASVNYYFGDKERLYVETIKLSQRQRIERVPLPSWPSDTPPEQKLRDFIATMVTRMVGLQEPHWQMRLMMREILHPTGACREIVQEFFRPFLDILLGILDEILPAETPQHKRYQMAFSVVGQCLHYRICREVVAMLVPEDELAKHYTPRQLADHISQVMLAALERVPTDTLPVGRPVRAVESK